MLSIRDKELCNKYSNRLPSMFQTSHFKERLFNTDPPGENIDKKYTYNNVKRWTKQFDVFTMDKLFFPLNLDNMHWTMIIIYMQLHEIHYYDSMAG